MASSAAASIVADAGQGTPTRSPPLGHGHVWRRHPNNLLNYVSVFTDEISLEGLDGITFSALATRLGSRPNFALASSSSSTRDQEGQRRLKQLVWTVAREQADIRVFKLREDRPQLVVFDRFQHIDSDFGIVMEPETVPEDIYPFGLVDETPPPLTPLEVHGLKGSCTSHNTREDVTEEAKAVASVDDLLLRHGGDCRLVLVASQQLRGRALLGDLYSPLLLQTLTAMQWCILERIGRSRFLGEVTQGKLSLQFTNEDPKSLFYHRKELLRLGLITKQIHYQKAKSGQNFQGTLFHLPRFYVERRSKPLVMVHSLIKLLQSNPNGIATYDDVKEHFNISGSVKMVTKNSEFQRFLKYDARVPYRMLYPDAPESEWKSKQAAAGIIGESGDVFQPKEKMVRVFQLRSPDMDAESIWNDNKEESLYEDEDDKNEQGLLDQSRWKLDRSMMHQAYSLVREKGSDGITQQELATTLGLARLEGRTVCRNLIRRNLVTTTLKDVGRNRIATYVAKQFDHLSSTAADFKMEKQKLDDLKSLGVESVTPQERSKIRVKSDLLLEDPLLDNRDVERDPTIEVSVSSDSFSAPHQKMSRRLSLALSSTSTAKKKYSPSKNPDSQVTCKQLKRANTIIKLVRQQKVIDDPVKLFKVIQEYELQEGHETRMDRKSLHRLLIKLSQDGQIKNIFMKLQLGEKMKTLHFICEPSVDESHTVIQSAVEQAKMKFHITPKPKARSHSSLASPPPPAASTTVISTVGRSLAELQQVQSIQTDPLSDDKIVYSSKFMRRYGSQPKFVRMRDLHSFLYYLTRGYDGCPAGLDKAEALQHVNAQVLGLVDAGVEDELAVRTVYHKEVSWKMFVPPLPEHEGWITGWVLTCDVLLRLPLSLFTRLVNVTTEIKGLEDYLDHPVRRHYLVRTLPTEIARRLLHQRKYIASVYEVASRLAFVGLLQFGPQKLKEKDQIFLYVNRNASLMDTTHCSPAYNRIGVEERDALVAKKYTFDKLQDIEKYWYDMWTICMETPLGMSKVGEEVEIKSMEKNSLLQEALNSRRSEEAPLLDLGDIPGDHLGAAGLDASTFAHVKRNWRTEGRSGSGGGKDKQEQQQQESRKRVIGKCGPIKVTQESNSERPLKRKKQKLTDEQHQQQPRKPKSKIIVRNPRANVVKRVIQKRKTTFPERKPYYDEKDKEALKLMRKLRVDWSPQEDSFLLVCRVAGSYLCQNLAKEMVQFTWVRDLLHQRFVESHNKTSRACQRRVLYMLRNKTTIDNVALFLAEVRQDEQIRRQFPLLTQGMGRNDTEESLNQDFEPLVELLVEKYKNASEGEDRLKLPNSIEEINAKYSIIHPQQPEGSGIGFEEPKDVSDIQASVVNCLITSSLCSTTDKTSHAFTMFKIYQQYPDSLLRTVLNKLRTDKMVSMKKNFNKSRIKRGNYLPLSSSPYQLSVSFSHKFLSRYQYDIYYQAWDMVKQFVLGHLNSSAIDVQINQEGGYAATIIGLMAKEQLLFRTEVPEQLIVLDPKLSMVDKQYMRILRRYQELLKSSGLLEVDKDLDFLNPALDLPAVPTTSSKKEITCSDLFKRQKPGGQSAAKRKSSTEGPSEKKVAKLDKDTEDGIIFCESSDPTLNLVTSERSNSLVAKSASRIALYMMREEIKDAGGTDAHIQHSHDFFVVATCQVDCKLTNNNAGLEEEEEEEKKPVKYLLHGKTVEIPRRILPGDTDAAKRVLNRFGLDLHGHGNQSTEKLKRTCFPREASQSLDDLVGRQNSSEEDRTNLRRVHECIAEGQHLGVTGRRLQNLHLAGTDASGTTAPRYVQLLLDAGLVLHCGVTSARFVAQQFSSPWLLHSFRLTRVGHREGLPVISHLGKKMLEIGDGDGRQSQEAHVHHHRRRLPDDLSGGNEIAEATEKVDWSKVDEVDVILRPWLRVDGTLNRRVLDRLLGAVLGLVMQRPGLAVSKVCAKFSPALQPMHCKELIDILVELGCATVSRLRVRGRRPGLFGPASEIDLLPSSILDDIQDLVVESEVDAIVKLGQFIGDKNYSVDFMGQCSCHPEK